jgi:hypothetical protein
MVWIEVSISSSISSDLSVAQFTTCLTESIGMHLSVTVIDGL